MRHAILIPLCLTLLAPAARAADETKTAAGVKFRAQEIDKSLKVGYGVKIVDLNGDGKLDIAVADSARVVWFSNPDWKLHTVVQNKDAGIKTDNVALDAYDIDGDGKTDIALGADWQPSNTKAGGSLHWLKQGRNIDEPWKAYPIDAPIPTLHRIKFADLDADGKAELIVGPLHGANATARGNWLDGGGVQVLSFKAPKDPAKDKWERRVLDESLHVMHNFLPVPMDGLAAPGGGPKKLNLLTASYEGVNLATFSGDGKATLMKVGAGDQSNPAASRGSSEIRTGRLKQTPLIATVEPFHGTRVVAYTPPAGASGLWKRTVLDEDLGGGHALWVADLDGDGADEIVAGWRDTVPGKTPPGVNIYKADSAGTAWQKHPLEKGGVATEDLACADLNGDGRTDIVAVGRATRNVKIYWNEGSAARAE